MEKGKIIYLNGVSSSGKSTLAKALTKALPDFFHYSIDDFDLVIEKMEDRKNKRLIPVETDIFFHRTIKMFSDQGVNLIVDTILHEEYSREDYLECFSKYPILFVGVHCPLNELERREKERGDRRVGNAASQLSFVHKREIYDIEVNTYEENLSECLEKIVVSLNNSCLEGSEGRIRMKESNGHL